MISVTQILKPWANFDAIPPMVLQEACQRGKVLHAAYAAYASGLWVAPLPEAYQGYFESWQHWYEDTVEETLSVEEELICTKYDFCGHPDWIGIIKGDKAPSLLDWKTGQAALKTHRLQIAAYHHLAKEKYGVKRVLLMHPKPHGGMARVPEHSGTLARDFATFLNCLTAFNFFKGG